jgi:hypothetical protein
MEIRQVEAELFHAEGRTDTTKLKLAFRNFANAPKMASLFSTGFTPDSQGHSHMQRNRKLCTAFLRLQVESVDIPTIY